WEADTVDDWAIGRLVRFPVSPFPRFSDSPIPVSRLPSPLDDPPDQPTPDDPSSRRPDDGARCRLGNQPLVGAGPAGRRIQHGRRADRAGVLRARAGAGALQGLPAGAAGAGGGHLAAPGDGSPDSAVERGAGGGPGRDGGQLRPVERPPLTLARPAVGAHGRARLPAVRAYRPCAPTGRARLTP